jgi:hypothetical protein
MSEKIAKSIEEYAPGLGHPNTLDGYRDWCAWRNDQETERKALRLAAERAARGK